MKFCWPWKRRAPPARSPALRPVQRDESHLVALGTYCENLMRDENFNALCDEFEAQSAAHILHTAPEDASRREAVYAEVQGQRAFLALMLTYVETRNNILKQSAHADDGDEAFT